MKSHWVVCVFLPCFNAELQLAGICVAGGWGCTLPPLPASGLNRSSVMAQK